MNASRNNAVFKNYTLSFQRTHFILALDLLDHLFIENKRTE